MDYSSSDEDRHHSRRRRKGDDSSSSDDEDLAFVRRRRREKDLQDQQLQQQQQQQQIAEKKVHLPQQPPPFDDMNYGAADASYYNSGGYPPPRRGYGGAPYRGYRGRGGGRGGGRGRRGSFRGGSDRPDKRRRFNTYPQSIHEEDVESEPETTEENSEYVKSLKKLIASIGDQAKHIQMLTTAIVEDLVSKEEVKEKESNDSKITATISTVILDSILRIPTKIAIYATVIALLNVKNSQFVNFLLSRAVDAFKDSISDCDWKKCKLLLRLFNQLVTVGVLKAHNVLNVYQPILDEIRKDDVCNSAKDTFVYVILGSLPWGVAKLQDEDSAQVSAILNTVGRYMHLRDKTISKFSSVQMQYVFQDQSNSSEYARDYLQVMWNQFTSAPLKTSTDIDDDEEYEDEEFNLASASAIYTPHRSLENELAQQEAIDLKIEFNKPSTMHFKIYKGRLGLYETLILAEYEGNSALRITKDHLPSPIDRLIIEEYISDFLHMNYLESHRENIDVLRKIIPDVLFYSMKQNVQNTMNDETSEEDILRQKAEKLASYITVDSLIGHIFILPLPPIRQQYYRTILSDLAMLSSVKKDTMTDEEEDELKKDSDQQREYKRIIDIFMNKLFDLIPEMDVECVTNRLALFFAQYLGQNNYKWDWDNWKKYLIGQQEFKWHTHFRQAFVRQVLSFIYRLSSMTDVHRCIQLRANTSGTDDSKDNQEEVGKPISFLQPFLPTTFSPFFKYVENTDNGDTVPYVKQAQEILSAMKGGMKASDITMLVNKQLESVSRTTMMEIFMHSLLLVSSKSLSQLQYYLDMYVEAIADLMEDKEEMDSEVKRQRQRIEMQCVITKSVWQYWRNSPQFCVITLQKLLMFDRSMLSTQSIVSFIFQNIDDENIKQSDFLLSKYFHVWEVLRSGLEAVLTRSIRAKQTADDALFRASISEIQETVLFLTKKYVQVLLVAPDDDDGESDWRYKCTMSHLKELIRRWQRFVPQQFQSFTSFIMNKYNSQQTLSQLSEISRIFKHSIYYSSLQISGGVETQADTEAIIQLVYNDNEALTDAIEQMKEDTYIYNFLHQSEFTI
jgi:hypothetical protein